MPSKRVTRLQKKTQEFTRVQEAIASKAVGYVRVSSEEQATHGYGLEAQERAIRAFAESQGYELIAVIQDSGVSGATRPASRPGFKRALALAEEKAFSVLLVWKFDRLARNLGFAVLTVDLLQSMDIVLRSVTEPIDTATPMGKTLFSVLAGMAEQERLSIVERTLSGKKEKAARGGFIGGPAPLGYTANKGGGLHVQPEEAETVRRIFSMRRQGATLQAIADVLNAEKVPTKRGGKWYPATVRYILDNPKYKGFVEYYFRWNGAQYIEAPGEHEPIIQSA